MNFKITPAKLFQYYLPVTLSLFMLITLKRTVVIEDTPIDRLYGFPLAYISSNFFCTGCYLVVVSTLLVDLAVYFLLAFLLGTIIERIGLRLKTHWLGITFGSVVSICWIALFWLFTADSSFQFTNDLSYKTTRTEVVFDQLP